ncbi:extracellular solute-binding protein [Paenibacillus sp. H1-7]|uniref:extracellular solute-binding protein n=1 Tax=Paenibacillus sp. H1-7 TaxID=2282849 RepID=UPI001EF95B16|nr:extracellular solute-binding protein [Paenibacillus sp. H1-7]ULL18502.1 extracellular solute-binding protein [Paenibacillus sp. H1-7]
MKKMKALLVFASIPALTLALAACSGNEPAGGKTDSAAAKGEKPVTFQFLRNGGFPEYPADGGEAKQEIIKALEKSGVKGVDYKVTIATGDEYTTKLNLLASSGELPDYFDIDAKTLSRFIEQGLVKPIDEYLKKTPNLVQSIPKAYWDQVTYNGKIYAVPNGTRPEAFNTPSVTSVLVRQDWLDNLKLKQPTTVDELHDVLKAFVTQDPDKNGKNDTVGFGATKTIQTSQAQLTQFRSIFGAFGIAPTHWMESGGQIKKGMVLPETKQALAVLQQWYKEGLIDPDFPVTERKQLEEKVVGSKIGVWEDDGYLINPQANPVAGSLAKATPSAKLALIAPPKGPGGKQGFPETNAAASAPLRALSAKAQNPEKLFQFLEWMATDGENGGFNYITYGIEGKDFTYDKASNTITQKVSYADLYKRGYSNPVRMVFIIDRRWTTPDVRSALELAGKHVIPNQLWRTVQAELDYPDLESKLWPEYLIKIITGVWPVEKHDEFVQKYYQQGGQQIEKQANEEWKKLKK